VVEQAGRRVESAEAAKTLFAGSHPAIALLRQKRPTPGWHLFLASPMSAAGTPDAPWPPESLALAQQLQRSLSIDDRQWHRLKSQRSRRAAEQLAAALVQLLAGDDPRASRPTPARQDATALVEHALGWLRAEIRDPGGPSHGR